MMDTLLTLLIGLLGGISVGIQSPLAGAMGQRVGGAASSFIVHLSGAIFSLVLLVMRGGESIREWRSLPLYMFGSGIFGLILYLTISHTLPRLGAGAALTMIIVGQLLMGMLIDHFGLFGVPVRSIELMRMIAAGLLLLGGYLMVR